MSSRRPVEDEAIYGDYRDEHVQAQDDATEEDSPEDVAAEEVHAAQDSDDPVEDIPLTHEDIPVREADVTEEPDPPVPAPRPTRNRLDALQTLMRYDVLNRVDGVTAKELISTLLCDY